MVVAARRWRWRSIARATEHIPSMVALIENSGFGGANAAPAIRRIYDVYYRKTRHEEPPGAVQIAKKPAPSPTPATLKTGPTIAKNQ